MRLSEYVSRLRRMQPGIEAKLENSVRNAAMRAVEKATELTPPTSGSLTGTGTRAGELKQHWATDSQVNPQRRGADLVATLANNKSYASYVNDGHRMDRHFVPGLHVNPASGLLEYTPGANVGIVVGTKTSYVPGLHMSDEAKKEFERVLGIELRGLEDLFR